LKPAQSRLSTLDRGAYAALAAMGLAKAQLAAGKRDDAIATLQSNPAADPALGAIQARRLARLLVDAGKADQALKMLPANSTDAAILQVRGDAHYALGQRDKAGEAYAQALANLKADAPERRLVELKLSEVGGTPPKPKAKS
jgi:predicted negative regulator of RcsB-dependent stress response